MNLAIVLKELREKRGFSQRQLAYLSGVSNTEISRIEKGERKKPDPEILRKLSKSLGVGYAVLYEAAGIINETKNDIDFNLDDIPPEGVMYFRKLKNLPPKAQEQFMEAFKANLKLIEQFEKNEED